MAVIVGSYCAIVTLKGSEICSIPKSLVLAVSLQSLAIGAQYLISKYKKLHFAFPTTVLKLIN